ncbi:AAA family ATPase [Cetobacterium sp. 8H]|uniref:UvrD-helicase domain-containing protein n=1 Tax=Cetobacterium sp. 8H TaxID=2759681 RepID=UPI00163C619F|nr:UvrD-helicase domain-containing protein [Cetobacterium sp. 8H]MBC2849905.1 AAA family ATPase [Cetobacterium sp. 8H]
MSLEIINDKNIKLETFQLEFQNKIKDFYKNGKAILYVKPQIRDFNLDFLLIDSLRGVFIFKVVDWKHEEIEYMNSVVGEVREKGVKNPFFQVKQNYNYFKGLFENQDFLLNESGELKFNFRTFVVFTQMKSNHIKNFKHKFNDSYKEYIPKENLGMLDLNYFLSSPKETLSDKTINCIRGCIYPEILITDIEKKDEFLNEDLVDETIKVLDTKQEKLAKNLENGFQIITGVPGSGKTVVLISRAIHLAKAHPNWKIKILTYNRTLKSRIESKINYLKPILEFEGLNLNNLTIDTFHTLALEIAEVEAGDFNNSDFWKDELPKIALSKATPSYDAILVDEYQDFKEDWIKVCIKSLNMIDNQKNLLLVGDPLQAIYNNDELSLKSLNLSPIDKNLSLNFSYRTGKKQMLLASNLILDDNGTTSSANVLSELENIKLQTNHNSEIYFVERGYTEIFDILNFLLIKEKINPEDLMILVPTNKTKEDFYRLLPNNLTSFLTFSKDFSDTHGVVTTYYSAKGLEAKICILVEFEKIKNKKIAYVALTRASEQTYIYCKEKFSNHNIIKIENFLKNIHI